MVAQQLDTSWALPIEQQMPLIEVVPNNSDLQINKNIAERSAEALALLSGTVLGGAVLLTSHLKGNHDGRK